MRRVLFYDDSLSFGGHHVSALDAVYYLAEKTDVDVCFLFYEGNTRLAQRLDALQSRLKNISLYSMPYRDTRLKTLGALLSVGTVRKIRRQLDIIQPDIVIVVQGSIEQCSLGLLAAKQGRYYTVCFIALTQRLAVMKGKLAGLRDYLNLYFYHLPDHFITISAHGKSDIIRTGTKATISLVYCGPHLNSEQVYDRMEARKLYGLAPDDYVVSLIGRVQFVHKGHDVLIDAITRQVDRLQNIKFLIVGDGPDDKLLQAMIQDQGLTDMVKRIPWVQDSSAIYAASDLLIIPSRFEGLPLVMLEAMYYGLPIVASNVDGMAEVLPSEWLFPFGDREALIETLLRVKMSDNSHYITHHRQRVADDFNLEKFGDSFYKAICN